jgi:hypothetical protein
LGYCLLPLTIAAVVTSFVKNLIYVKLPVALVGIAWSTFAAVGFMAALVPSHRKVLAVYPVFLFYFALGWMVCLA